jgi:hypothetical protein
MSLETAMNTYQNSINYFLDQRGIDPKRLAAAGTFYVIDLSRSALEEEEFIPPGIRSLVSELYAPRSVLPYRFEFDPNHVAIYVQPLDEISPYDDIHFTAAYTPDPEDYSEINKAIHKEWREELDYWFAYTTRLRNLVLIPREEMFLENKAIAVLNDEPSIRVPGSTRAEILSPTNFPGTAATDYLSMRIKAITEEHILELASIIPEDPIVAAEYAKPIAARNNSVIDQRLSFQRQVTLFTKLNGEDEACTY